MLVLDLQRALVRNEFFLQYQPIFNCRKQLICAEALVRWHHPRIGIIPPVKFIPLLDVMGLTTPFNEWLLNAACRQSKAWQEEGLPPIPVAVNISLLQFEDKSFVRTVCRILNRFGLPPTSLELELTEGDFAHDLDDAAQALNELHEHGVAISLDDFGTGFSSLSYLQRFPLHKLKIDKSFVADVDKQPRDQAIVQAVIDMAHSIDLEVVAEGVETEAQWNCLREQRCDYYQGYLLGRPMDADAFYRFAMREMKRRECRREIRP